MTDEQNTAVGGEAEGVSDQPPRASADDKASDATTLGAQSRVRWMTSKREFRARAHSNPLNDGLFTPPSHPGAFDLSAYFTAAAIEHATPQRVSWCDIGCGYGGLLASLAVVYPRKLMLGLEIRDRVAEFCRSRVAELRRSSTEEEYGNISFERTNAMKLLPFYFAKGSLEKMFFCYPDPHFKRRKNRQRIISSQLLDEYAFVLAPSGRVYVVTDVEELFKWMVERLSRHPLFERVPDEEHAKDPVTPFVRDMTDEAQRVEKSDRQKQHASFVRLPNPA